MPAASKAQQRAAGMALAAKRGEMDVSELEGAAKDMYDSMTEKELEDFAETEHKGLPNKMENINMIKLKDLLLNERIDREYKGKFPRYVVKQLKNKNLGAWEVFYENSFGGVGFTPKRGNQDFVVFITPFWDKDNVLPVDIYTDGGDPDRFDMLRWTPTGDAAEDLKQYLKTVIPALNKIKRKYSEHI